jgi:acyl-CoA hydrolase
MMEQPLQRRRGTKERHVEFASHHLDRHVDSLDSGEDARHKVAIFETLGVASAGRLVVSRAVDVVKDRARHAGFRKFAQVGDVSARV